MISHIISKRKKLIDTLQLILPFITPLCTWQLVKFTVYYPFMQCFSSFYPFVIHILFMKLIVENSKVSWFRPH